MDRQALLAMNIETYFTNVLLPLIIYIPQVSFSVLVMRNPFRKGLNVIYQQTNELRGLNKKSGESFSTFPASVPRPAFEIIKVGKMWVKRKMQKNTAI